MKRKPEDKDDERPLLEPSALRKRAEERHSSGGPCAEAPPSDAEISEADVRRQLHELHVYQVELELQQEALQQALEEIEEVRAGEREQARRLEELSRRLLTVQELERRRLSAELHDRTSPNLAAIQISLKALAAALSPTASREVDGLLADMAALLQDTGASIRDICADLRPPVLDHAGLVPALESYARQVSLRGTIAVHIDAAGWSGRLSADHESLLFRIAQEAITNCAKHAQASRMDIVLADRDGQAVLNMADDGVGFSPEAVEEAQARGGGGQGLLIMRERAEFAGAILEVDSRPGAGTRIRVAMPGTATG